MQGSLTVVIDQLPHFGAKNMPTQPDGLEPNERRAWVRFPCDLGSACYPTTSDDHTRWAARMHDVSRGGVGLIVDRRFEPGTILNIQLEGDEQDLPAVLLARVVHITAHKGGKWSLGCRFARELTQKDMEALLR
jgi:hypothetical protein